MHSKAATVKEYLESLPPDRRQTVQAVRKLIRDNLDAGYEEGMQYGMIGYYVKRSVYPAGYHCDPKQPLPYVSLASQKNHLSLYLFCVYTDPAHAQWFTQAWAKTGKKLNMGKSCVRFKKLDDLPLEVIAQALRKTPAKKFIAGYEACLAKLKQATAKTKPALKPAPRKPAAGQRATASSTSKPRS